ncbi:MAG: UDP-N-acetylmuramoyl-tripeptide--D-alanyl-D-alanine ligase [Negativicoccus massiliensis]|uniref:UDP-N-acetylmuramoyl-tripeptide--D-alanyl-D- alanine ligase n=2 Tax=Negativicoccus succinicivorans TaxID=620903 RepID=UPI0026F2BA78|nr:UDP-N-acetylmuramoyl-tripeptide--D-alanyl-D-alanine ligase [Negativicoccus succinicivorans]MBS5886931.1 UDP-N-acetylmuramoyl-tripeptide--D-alanyl-D-alanine ligase [Negativicoccus succinicivorans]MDU3215070.1 UDP-N-acetylmuramoyl-tripeptide--D-alanyl-D-alanine ligase [Negativicoccus succinicivorans]MDU4641948.1 UDP-N-acetylmuramoyl-tripeptide--D-alanyl-D-alanine ligase [Negativicoccus massiliensis]
MAAFTEAEIIQATEAVKLQGSEDVAVGSISTDTRGELSGCLFVPLKGERFDGHDYLQQAVEKGAVAVLCDREIAALPKEVAVYRVKQTRRALEDLAAYHRRRFALPVIAVTGSSGKTTTKELIASVLAQKFRVHKTEKNHNNEIGLAQTLLSLQPEDEVCVVEMGMRARGEIKRLAEVAAPTIGVVTNVGVAHLERLGSQDAIAAAKQELIESIPENGTAVLNWNDKRVRSMASVCHGRVISYGIEPQANVQALDIQYGLGKTKFTCRIFDEVFPVTLPLLGAHNVANALATVAVARVLGLSANRIQRALADAVAGELRQEIIDRSGIRFVNDAYNANPLSMAASLTSLSQFGEGRYVAVIGDMLELGPDEVAMHEELATAVIAAGITELITVGPLARALGEAVKKQSHVNVHSVANTNEVMPLLKPLLQEGDIVLIKGSHSLRLDTLVTEWSNS